MSGAEGWSRRSALGGGAAALAMSTTAKAQGKLFIETIDTPDGRLEPSRRTPLSLGYLGIRYGVARRFELPVRSPAPAQPYLERGGFGPVCPQQGKTYSPQDEDCLFLNVWRAARAPHIGRPLPVMVYFHGGAYSTGSVTDPLNDGARLAARGDVVVVTVNHRLNVFGYLYQPERFPDSGNLGQLDLILALQWVRGNIAAFGGDPGNVTLFGQSGGGAKIATLMAMPAAKGLFHKAITMSGQQVTASGPLHARKRTEAFLARLASGVDPATAPVEALVAALGVSDPILGGGLYMGPVLDMRSLTRHPFWPDAAPQSLGIPMMLGNTVAETRAFFPPDHPRLQGLDWANLPARISPEIKIDLRPDWIVDQFRARYPRASPQELFHRIVTPARSWRGQVEEAEARARAGRGNTFVYQLDFEQAKHTDDIGLAFGTTGSASHARQAMSDTVMNAFVRFARTGNPGWPAYDLGRRATMVFDTSSRVVNDPRKWERELFARVPYIQPGS